MSDMRVDQESMLVDVSAETRLADLEKGLGSYGFTLDLAKETDGSLSVAEWLEQGAPGARNPWLDPTDHLVAGVEALFTNGTKVRVRPTSRRATGPDLLALIFGMRRRFATITRAWLRVQRIGIPRPVTAAFEIDRNPPLTPDEARLLDTIERELKG